MDWIQAIVIIASLSTFMFWIFSKLDTDIKLSNQRQDLQMQRIDQLYSMFIDLLKHEKNAK
jgi:hypothetical protein